MTLKHMKIFVTVCQCNSVTAAADKLFIAQPSVSLAIRELEEYYGIKLFDRISRKLYITEAGKKLLDYAVHIVSLFDVMEKEMRNWDTLGILRIGSSITIGNFLLTDYIKLFRESHPFMKVQVIIENSVDIENRIMANDIDFGLIEGITHNSQIESETFMEDELVLICGPAHPLSTAGQADITSLPSYDFIMREKGSGGRELFESSMLIHGIDIKPVWESVSTRAIVKAVSEGLGLSVLPYQLIKQDLEEGKVIHVKVEGLTLKRFYSFIYHKNKMHTKSAKDFMELCKNNNIRYKGDQ